MYRFSFVESVAGRAQEVSRQLFNDIVRRPQIADTCERIAAATSTDEVGRLKRQLPAFCWHAWFEGGVRRNDCAHTSGLVMIDLDHIADPRALFGQLCQPQPQRGQAAYVGGHRLLAAHVTPSSHGLRLVFVQPEGTLDVPDAQAMIARDLGLSDVDTCTKDLARLSFCVPASYWLWVDGDALFEGPVPPPIACPTATPPAPPQPAAVAPPLTAPASLPAAVAPAPAAPDREYPADYDGIEYPLLVAKLQDLLGGAPAHGSRNNFIFSMAAHLRYVCDDDAEWIARVLPTYGEERQRWRRTIDSACQRSQQPSMPPLVRRAIGLARKEVQTAQIAAEAQTQSAATSPLPPPMPTRLPRLISHLVKNVPQVCRPAVANAVFPALAAHLKGVKFWLIDGTEKEATFMCVTMARQSSGKSAVNKPIEYIVADIVQRDELSRQREQEWKNAMSMRSANSEKPQRPTDLCVQVLVSDMTNAAFVQRMKDADGRYLYTNLDELDLLRQLQTNGTKDVGKIICLCFDNGKYGQERVGTQSVTARVDLRWNWNASSTIQKGIRFFEHRLVDGTLSRINLCTIVPDPSLPFVYGKYDQAYADELRPYINNLNLASGHVMCRQALQLASTMHERCLEVGALTDDDVYRELAHRAVTIAYLKAMVLYICNGMKWSREIADFAQWSLDYDLWCKCYYFGSKLAEASNAECVGGQRCRRNLLDLLPDTFSLQQAQQMRREQGLPENARLMLAQWTFRGYIVRDELAELYVKTDEYLKRKNL